MSKGLEALECIKHTTDLYRPNELNGYKKELDIIETELKDYEKKTKLAKEYADVNNVAKRLKALEIIKENLNIDEILLAIKGVCKASDYDLVKEVLL